MPVTPPSPPPPTAHAFPSRTALESLRLPEFLDTWWPEIAAAGATVILSIWQILAGGSGLTVVSAVAVAAAAATFRRRPGLGVLLLWGALFWVYAAGTSLPWTGVLVSALLSFGTARFGNRLERGLGVLSILIIPVAAVLGLERWRIGAAIDMWRTGQSVPIPWTRIVGDLSRPMLLWAFVLVLPWILGRVALSVARSREREEHAQRQQAQAERERGYAQEVAELRAGQAQLARDVHDVVGHSLAVILAQAESAQYLQDDETDKMRETLANVATSARRSLQDVRAVLSPSSTAGKPPATGLDALIDGVATAGNDVRRRIDGTPRPLPPDLEQVAYRVLQEMLTNALKHGHRGGPVWVDQAWPADWRSAYLRLEVRNLVDDTRPAGTAEGAPGGGLGIAGMRYRLETAGGQLAVTSGHEGGGTVFTATAWLPLRAAEVDLEGTR